MNSVPPEPSELVNRLRQQLILAQVRIMELEDVRDGLMPRLAEAERLLRAAQDLADGKLDEAAHLGKVLSDTQAHAEQLHQAHEASSRELVTSRTEHARTGEQLRQEREDKFRLETELGRLHAASAAHLDRIARLDTELRAMKSSPSWRWTAWLRSLSRWFGGKRP
jgi:chromosome segregation ATPase